MGETAAELPSSNMGGKGGRYAGVGEVPVGEGCRGGVYSIKCQGRYYWLGSRAECEVVGESSG
jgi:hypothetical protein